MQAPTRIELERVIALCHAGQVVDAERHARKLTARFPGAGMAWKLLGTILGMQGKSAHQSLEWAARLLPEDHEVHYNLGLALQASGQLSDAETSYCQALVMNSQYAEAHNNLGFLLQELGQLVAGLACYQRALASPLFDAQRFARYFEAALWGMWRERAGRA